MSFRLREELRLAQVTNMRADKTLAPANFDEFRMLIGSLLESIEAPQEAVDDALDLEYEGVGVPEALEEFWSMLQSDRQADPETWSEVERHGLSEMYRPQIYDLVLNIAAEYTDPDTAHELAGKSASALKYIERG